MKPEDERDCADPVWRLCKLYSIINDAGTLVPFRPTPEQMIVINAIYVHGWQRIIIPKARQLGMSTVLILIAFDLVLWRSGIRCALVDKTGDDASKKMRGKVKVAWESMHPEVVSRLKLETLNESTFAIRWQDDAASTFEAGIGYRGDTLQFLHVSEWGWVQARDGRRSREIRDGALPAAERNDKGVVVIETTWEGGKAGELWAFVREALETPAEKAGPRTWRLLFFPWQTNPSYTLESEGWIDETSQVYFDELTARGISLSEGQKRWYANQRRTRGWKVRQEYPSSLEECWTNPTEGSIYGEELGRVRVEGRLKEFPWLREFPIFTFWDLGMSDYTSIWLLQFAGNELLWLDWFENEGQPASHYADHVRRWEAEFKPIYRHFLPHDGARREIGSGVSYQSIMAKLGLGNTVVVPATYDVWLGIQQLREIMPRSVFHTRCDIARKGSGDRERLSGFACLEGYRKKVEHIGSGTSLVENPVHDHTSHSADAARLVAEAMNLGIIPSYQQAAKTPDVIKRRGAAAFKVGG